MNGLFRFSSALAPRASIAGLRCASSIAYGHAPERTQKLERNQAIEDGDGIPTYVEYVEYFDLNGNPENYTQAHDHGHGHGHGDHDAHHNEQNPGDVRPPPPPLPLPRARSASFPFCLRLLLPATRRAPPSASGDATSWWLSA